MLYGISHNIYPFFSTKRYFWPSKLTWPSNLLFLFFYRIADNLAFWMPFQAIYVAAVSRKTDIYTSVRYTRLMWHSAVQIHPVGSAIIFFLANWQQVMLTDNNWLDSMLCAWIWWQVGHLEERKGEQQLGCCEGDKLVSLRSIRFDKGFDLRRVKCIYT